jgi:hypothetical protein
MKRITLTTLLFLVLTTVKLFAHEGMWIPLFLGELNEAQMKEMGMKISADDIYSINHASLKDAIVIFGRGCTGEVVSDQGLVLTNHYCGYGAIQSHSSIEHDYLTDGFWAMNKAEELPNPGLTVTFLVEMREVTKEALSGISDDMDEGKRKEILDANLKKLKEANAMDNGIDVRIKPFFSGNRYFMFFYEVYKDIRLVGTPPSNIGKFGGDTDNWMWPRHTGDFSVFRIYANKDNKPATYSKDNVPYQPKMHLKISLQGIEEDDFTFVYGYPGRTEEYLVSDAVSLISDVENPIKIKLRTLRLDVMKAAQNQDPKVRIQYAGKVAHIANGWKKWQGENRGVKRTDIVNRKRALEGKMQAWMEEQPDMKKKYGDIIPTYHQLYKQLQPLRSQYQYFREAGMGIEAVSFASSFRKLMVSLESDTLSQIAIDELKDAVWKKSQSFFKDYNMPIDQKIAVKLLDEYIKGVQEENLPDIFGEESLKNHHEVEKYVNHAFQKSIIVQQEELLDLMKKSNKKIQHTLAKDPFYQFSESLYKKYDELIIASKEVSLGLSALDRRYMQMQMAYQPNKTFYPDANFTLRLTYGKVDGYKPRDAVNYNFYTTLSGIMEKENPNIYDYVVEDKLKQLYKDKDFGKYANKSGEMNVCFLASNHTSGGNSGSPVFNADGNLIGLNFDRNWEGTMSDIVYDPDQCRNITLDIRYCLFIIDKFAGASHLVKEMTLVEKISSLQEL